MYRNQNATSDTCVCLLSWSETLLKISSLRASLSLPPSPPLFLPFFTALYGSCSEHTLLTLDCLLSVGSNIRRTFGVWSGLAERGGDSRESSCCCSFLGEIRRIVLFGYTPLHLIYLHWGKLNETRGTNTGGTF